MAREQVPRGLSNDAAEEALRGVALVESGRFEAVSLRGVGPDDASFGNSMETLFLYLVGAAAQVMGTTTLAIHLTTWLFTLLSIALLCRLTRRIDPALPVWVPLLLAFSSIWLFHYARTGLRANTAPFFLLAFALLLDRAERPGSGRGIALACGATLGLGLYGYTSCRVLPVAFLLYGLARLWHTAEPERIPLMRRYGVVVAGAVLCSLPNILFLLRHPQEFIERGSYVVRGGTAGAALNILWTLLLPVYYPAFAGTIGPSHYFDGVSVSLTMAGIRPLHPLVGAAFLAGLVRAWRRRRDPAVSFLLWAWLAGTLLLGLSGPSLTRLLLLLPVYLVLAGLGIGAALRFRAARPLVGAALLMLMFIQGRQYFVTYARDAGSRRVFSEAAATPMGNRARALAARGLRVVCVVSSDANVIRYLTHDVRHAVRVVEFLDRPLNAREIPLQQFRPHVLLVDRAPGFEPLHDALQLLGSVERRPEFDEFRLGELPDRAME